MSPISIEVTNELPNPGFIRKFKHKLKQNEEHISEGSSFFVALGFLSLIIPMTVFVLSYYFLFYIDIFTRKIFDDFSK